MKKTEKEAQKKVTIDSRIKGLKNQQLKIINYSNHNLNLIMQRRE